VTSRENQLLHIPVSFGDALDKLSIVEIKLEMISDPDARKNLDREKMEILNAVSSAGYKIDDKDYSRLRKTNLEIYHLMDAVFAENEATLRYAELSKLTVDLNVERAYIKREINMKANSHLIEEKSYFRGD
jgi:hypothetical protein